MKFYAKVAEKHKIGFKNTEKVVFFSLKDSR